MGISRFLSFKMTGNSMMQFIPIKNILHLFYNGFWTFANLILLIYLNGIAFRQPADSPYGELLAMTK